MFNNILKQLRSDKNLTQEGLAEKLNVTKGAVAMWETGKREPDTKMLIRIASFFDISIDYLLGYNKSKTEYEKNTAKENLNNNYKENNLSKNISCEYIDNIENNIPDESLDIINKLDVFETPYILQRKSFKDANNQTYYIFAISYSVTINNKTINQNVYFDTYDYYEHCQIQKNPYIEKYDYNNLYGIINAALETQSDIKLKILRKVKSKNSSVTKEKYLYFPIIETLDDSGTPIICLLSLRNNFITYQNLISKLKSQKIIK